MGTVKGSELSKTREPTNLLVSLAPDVRARADTGSSLWVDFEQVQSIRRTELKLEHPLEHILEENEK